MFVKQQVTTDAHIARHHAGQVDDIRVVSRVVDDDIMTIASDGIGVGIRSITADQQIIARPAGQMIIAAVPDDRVVASGRTLVIE